MKQIKRLLFVILLFSFGCKTAWAGKVVINGKLSGFKRNSLVRVLINADPFSKWKVTLASVRADDEGNFHLTFSAEHPYYAQLAVNLSKGNLFLFPDGMYHLKIINDTVTNGSVFDRKPLNIDIHAEDDGQTLAMEKFNTMYNSFLDKNYRAVYQYHSQGAIDRFKAKADSVFSKNESGYLKEYIKYSIAQLEWGSRKYPVTVFAGKYFVGQPVLYHNIQYAGLFNQFFRNYFAVQPASPVSIDNLSDAIASQNLEKLDALFRKDSVLKKDARVRQMAELTLLSKLFYQNAYQQNEILGLIKSVSQTSPFLKNRVIARNWIQKLTYLLPGTPAPKFKLPDFNGNELSIGHWKGKFVLLAFYKTQCPLCLVQWNQIEQMQEKLGSDFVPVAIIKGEKTTPYQNLFEKENGIFTYLLLGNDILLPEKYQVITYPSYVLLAPDGTIAMAPAPMPDDNALQKISLFMQEYKKRKQK